MRGITSGLVENDSRPALARQRTGGTDNARLFAIAYQCGSRITRIQVPCAVFFHDMVVLYHFYCALQVGCVCRRHGYRRNLHVRRVGAANAIPGENPDTELKAPH